MAKEKNPVSNPAARRSPHHLVVSLGVTGGFLAGAHLEFADGLNCLIGGRGAGKTTTLEFLRFGLGLMPDPKVHTARHKGIESLVKANLGSGRLAIDLRTRTDMRYTASRTANESVQVLNEVGTAVPVSLDRDQIFGADVFSQNEIEEIASNPTAQLDLLDRFQEQEAFSIAQELDQLHRQLDQSSLDLRRLDEEIEDLRGRASEALAIQERLKGLVETEGPDAGRINAAHAAKSLRAREETIPAVVGATLERVVRDAVALQAVFRTSIEAHINDALLAGRNRDLFEQYTATLKGFSTRLADAVTSIEDAARATATALSAHGAALAERHALQEAEYRGLVAASEEQGGRAAERTTLQGGLATAQTAAADQLAKEKRRIDLSAARTVLLNRVSELRDRRFLLRKGVAERLSRQFPSIRVGIIQAADVQMYRDMVAEALKGAGLKQGMVADRLTQAFLPGELASVVHANDRSKLAERASLDDERASKIVDALRRTGTAYAIETVDIDDRPSIELLDGGTYKDSAHLSTGQRCTTILPILLTQSERPLLIDQPEDNLDNAFVYETIVSALRAVKGSRQVIFVTHNPNIPVLGEAERVFVFASDGQHAAVKQVGTVDECKEEIERILEGGREAFLQRKARYGH